eukprot:gene28671-32932_t
MGLPPTDRAVRPHEQLQSPYGCVHNERARAVRYNDRPDTLRECGYFNWNC